MSIGMTYDEFWNRDVSLVRVYRKADELRYRQKNQELWVQGAYLYDVLCRVSPLFRFTTKKGVKPEPYIPEPYPLSAAESTLRKEKAARIKEEKMKAAFAGFVEQMRRDAHRGTPK